MENSDWQVECGEIRQRGARLLASAQWVDCSFLVGRDGAPQQAHRLLLAMASPVFQAMFYGPLAERDAPIPLPDISPEVFQQLLQYIYTDQINLDSYTQAIELYYAAQKYMLRRLQRLCTTYLSRNLGPQSACRIYEFAYCIGDKKLECKSLKVIKGDTKLALSKCNLKDLSLATLISIFSMDDITIDSELDLFAVAEDYYLAHPEEEDEEEDGEEDEEEEWEEAEEEDQKSIDEKSTLSTSMVNVQLEDIPNGNNNDLVENHEEKLVFNDKSSKQNEQDKEFATDQKNLLSSDLPLACIDTEKEDDRARSEATFRFTVNDIKNLEETVLSPPCYVCDLTWKIMVKPTWNKQAQKQLGVYLQCTADNDSCSWSCVAEFKLKLVKHKPDSVPLQRNSSKQRFRTQSVFLLDIDNGNSMKNARGFAWAWDHVLDPNKGYIKDDSITVEAHLIAQEPDGIPLSMKKLSKRKDLSMETLVKQIRFLTLTSQQLAEYKPKSYLLTEHDIHALLMNIGSTKTYVSLPKMFSKSRGARKPQEL